MDSYWPQAVLTAKAVAVGGLLALDAQSCLHLVAAQPLVSGVLAGWVFGDVWLGLTVGAYLQLVWAYGPAPGRAPGPDTASGTVVGVGVAHAFSSVASTGHVHIALGFAVAIAVAWAGRHLEVIRRRINEALAERALRRLRDGEPFALARAHAAAFALAGTRGAAVCGAGCAVGLALGWAAINHLAIMDFGAAFALIPCVGIASFFLGIVRANRKGLAFFAAGVAVALLAGFRVPFP